MITALQIGVDILVIQEWGLPAINANSMLGDACMSWPCILYLATLHRLTTGQPAEASQSVLVSVQWGGGVTDLSIIGAWFA